MKKKSNRSLRKEERKMLRRQSSRPMTKEEWDELMFFYENKLNMRWFYHDWVKAGKPT